MHKIFDLREMDIEQLHSLAEELKIKGYKKLEKDKLIYDILDEEAKLNALNAPEKPKRGRPRKEKPAAEAKPVKQNEAKEEKPVEKKEDKKETRYGCFPSAGIAHRSAERGSDEFHRRPYRHP